MGLYYTGCLTTLAGFVVVWALFTFSRAVDVIILGFCVCLLPACLIQIFRGRSRLSKILYERGLGANVSLGYLREKMATVLRSPQPPRYVVTLQGRGLPHGGDVNVVGRIEIDGRQGEIEIRAESREVPGQHDFGRSALDAELAKKLIELIERCVPDPKSVDFHGRDGFPCQVLIGCSNPFFIKRADCNISDAQDEPVLQLARGLYEAGARLKKMDLIVGSCDDKGNVDVRPM